MADKAAQPGQLLVRPDLAVTDVVGWFGSAVIRRSSRPAGWLLLEVT